MPKHLPKGYLEFRTLGRYKCFVRANLFVVESKMIFTSSSDAMPFYQNGKDGNNNETKTSKQT